jgi:hypothetical protein
MQVGQASNGTPSDHGLVLWRDSGDDSIPPGFPVIAPAISRAARNFQHIFVLCSDCYLPEIAEFVRQLNRQHKLQALLVRTDTAPELLPQMLVRANLRFVRNILVYSDSRVPRRMLSAWQCNAQSELIANAAVAGDRLIVVSCEPKTYEVAVDQLPALKKIPARERRNFEIAEDGSFIWWHAADVHLDLDAIRSVIDPARRRKAERLRRAYGREYGAAIAGFRRECGIKQSEIPGFSERQLRRIEQSGDVSVNALRALAEAHRMSLDEYLNAVAHRISPARPVRTRVEHSAEKSRT